jgi:outer membrane protein OmpA-like peptidoglycan-associated protein
MHPAISADGRSLYFCSDMGGGQGGMDIWVSKIGADGKWGTPKNLGDKVNTKGNELFPMVTSGNLLYFSSDGWEGLGGLDIFEVKLRNDVPGNVYNMGKPINSEADDFGIIIAGDGKSGYFSSNRKHGGLDDDIFKFTVLREVKRGKILNLITKDKDSGEPLANSVLYINADSVNTNEKGEYQTVIEEDVAYNLRARKEKYFEAKDSVSTKSSEEDEFSRTLLLEKDPNLSLYALITDTKSGQALDGVKITIKDNLVNAAFDTYTTTASGDYKKPLKGKKIGDKLNYQITLEKSGYLTKVVTFTYTIVKEGEIKTSEIMNMSIGKVEVGMDLAKMIDMKPIYFDLGKSNIRKDAAIELDKVVAVMKQYPNMIIELGSHTDCRSSAAANLKLSGARAKNSAAYIISKGIAKTRITGKGYGESKLLNGCACEGKVKSTCTEEEHAKNRRTEFIIVKLK